MKATAEKIYNYLGTLLYSPNEARLDVDSLPAEFREVGQGLLYFSEMLQQVRDFAAELGKGNLDVTLPPASNELVSPLKSLHANLKHLVWQSKQVAKGDYKQRVDFMGEFADAFNLMIRQLDDRQTSLLAEMETNRQKSRDLERHIVLLATITERLPQWIVVVDNENGESLFLNGAVRDATEEHGDLVAGVFKWMRETASCDGDKIGRNIANVRDVNIETAKKSYIFAISSHAVYWMRRRATAFVASDVTAEREAVNELQGLAYLDTLTKVSSRHFGMNTLRNWVAQHKSFCLCFIDLDGLKYVNDTFGHHAGDDYILAIAALLRDFSHDAVVSRLGGDEFMILQPEWNEETAITRAAELRAECIKQNTDPFNYVRSMSYGVVEVRTDNDLPLTDILSVADEKMYAFKKAHKMQRVN